MKSIYIASKDKNAGSMLVTLGMMDIISHKVHKLGFFKPIILKQDEKDGDIEFVLSRYGIQNSYEECIGFDTAYVEMMIAENKTDTLLEELIAKYKALEEKCEFIVCQGIQLPLFKQKLDFDINIKIAQNLGTAFIDVINAKEMNTFDLKEATQINKNLIEAQKCFHFATFINRIDPTMTDAIKKELNDDNTFFLEELKELDTPTIGDIIDSIDARPVILNFHDRSRLIKGIKVAALTLDNFLKHIEDGDLIVVPADRSEIIIALFCAAQSQKFPHVAGIVLPFDMEIDNDVLRLIEGMQDVHIPILSVKSDTYTTVKNIDAVKAELKASDERKTALALGLFGQNVKSQKIETRLTLTPSQALTPMMFEYKIAHMAKTNKRTIVLPESEDDRILRAAEIVLRSGIAEITLLGDEAKIRQRAGQLGIDIQNATLINPFRSSKIETYADTFYELRKHKGLSRSAAYDAMQNPTYFATMMVHTGDADGMVSGASHTTAETIRPALQIIKTTPDISIVSSLFFICLDTQVLIYADCAVNEDPNAEELAQIALSTAKTAQQFGIDPKAAMLSYSTGDSGSGEDVEKVREATRIAQEKAPSLLIEGPIQYDAAIDKEVAKKKLPGSHVAGEANVFIFPDLNTGNNTYKAVQRSTGAIAIGPVLQGLNKPVNDLSRGCSVVDIVNTIAITAIQAGKL